MSWWFPLNSLSIASAQTLFNEINKLSFEFLENAAIRKVAYGFLLQLISTVYSPSPKFQSYFSITSLLGSKFSAYLIISFDFHLYFIDFDLSLPKGFRSASNVLSCSLEDVFSSFVLRPRYDAEMSLRLVRYFSCWSVMLALILFRISSSLSHCSCL